MSIKNEIIQQQLDLMKTLGIDAKLRGSYGTGEHCQYSDIDFHCFDENPKKLCEKVQKYFDFIFPYYQYMNIHNPSEKVCNLKFYVQNPIDKYNNYNFDLTIFPLNYQPVYLKFHEFRRSKVIYTSQVSHEYREKKTTINQLIYKSETLEKRTTYFSTLRQLKNNYFNQCIKYYCNNNKIDHNQFKKYFAFAFDGAYIGNIKIK